MPATPDDPTTNGDPTANGEGSTPPATPDAADTTPTTPLNDGASVPPAGPTPPPAAAPVAGEPEKKSRVGLFVGIGVGAFLLLAGAIAAVVLLVIPMFVGGAASTSAVRDLNEEPEDSWTYEFEGDGDADYLEGMPGFAAIGDDSALVWARFDIEAFNDDQGDSYGWFEGYDEQYDLGYDAGLAYEEAFQAWMDDDTYELDYPSYDEYFLDEWYDEDDYSGYMDGFYDGEDGEERGANKVEAPEEPDYAPLVSLVNLDNGEESWTIDLAEEADADARSFITATNVAGSPYLVVTINDAEGDSKAVSIDRSSGAVKSTLEFEGSIDITPVDGHVVVMLSDADEEATIQRLDPADLEGEPVWEEDADDVFATFVIDGTWVVIAGSDGGEVLHVEDGKAAEWGDDFGDEGVTYDFAGGQLLRVELNDDEFEIEAYSTETGKSVWDDAVDAEWYSTTGGVLLIGDETSDGYDNIQRINPSNGEPMWDDEYDDEISGVGGVMDGSIVAANPKDRIVVIDASNGEERFTQKISDVNNVWFGSKYYYVASDDELAALSVSEKGEVWTFDLDEEHSIVRIGDRLMMIDTDKRELIGLE